MHGMQLSRDYFMKVAYPLLQKEFPDLCPGIAAGLVGNGSECFGYDDELSRDHDWGVDFFIWLTEGDAGMIKPLQEWKSKLLDENPPEFMRTRSDYGARIGVLTCGDFYASLIGAREGPQTLQEWLRVPEENLAMTVNGEIFVDNLGEFTKTRKYLLDYYPEDLRRKRIAAKCMAIAQTGQYNFERTAKREDWVTLRTILSRFTDNVIAMVFYLNKTYRPYYKLAYRVMSSLPVLGDEVSQLLLALAETIGLDEISQGKHKKYISLICELIVTELKNQNLCSSDDWFLTTHGEEVQSTITDSFLKNLPTQYEI